MRWRGARRALCAGLLAFMVAGSAASAQNADRETLADIRQQLFKLYATMEQLRLQLRPAANTAAAIQAVVPETLAIERIDNLESELRQAFARIEELEFRIIRIAEDGARQIRDLEFRLIELGGGDLASLQPGEVLGGDPDNQQPARPSSGARMNEAGLSAGEQQAFNRALLAYNSQDYGNARTLFREFSDRFAVSELNVDSHYYRAHSLANLGKVTEAARAFLDSYRLNPTGPDAPRALFGLAGSLATLDQVAESCRLYQEIIAAFPGSTQAANAAAERAGLECN